MKSPIVHLGFALLLCIVVLVGYRFWYSAIIAKNASAAEVAERYAPLFGKWQMTEKPT